MCPKPESLYYESQDSWEEKGSSILGAQVTAFNSRVCPGTFLPSQGQLSSCLEFWVRKCGTCVWSIINCPTPGGLFYQLSSFSSKQSPAQPWNPNLKSRLAWLARDPGLGGSRGPRVGTGRWLRVGAYLSSRVLYLLWPWLKLFLLFCILGVEFLKVVGSKDRSRIEAESGAAGQSGWGRRKGPCYGLNCVPPKRYTEVLPPRTCACDLIWK